VAGTPLGPQAARMDRLAAPKAARRRNARLLHASVRLAFVVSPFMEASPFSWPPSYRYAATIGRVR
jgi:hypothetical protein